MASVEVLQEVRSKFETFTKKPENFLKVQHQLANNLKKIVKNLYDYTKSVETSSSGDALPELIIQDFDEEQIWQQLELQNEAVSNKFIKDISFFAARKKRLRFTVTDPTSKPNTENHEHTEESVSSSDDHNDEDIIDRLENGEHLSSSEELEESPEDKKNVKNNRKAPRTQHKPSIVDDTFFKLGQMEEFLEREEKKEHSHSKLSKKRTGDDSDTEDDDDESVDFFEDIGSEDSSDEDSALKAKYKDFFDEPDSGGGHNADQSNSNDKEDEENNKKSVRFNLPSEEDGEGSDSEEESDHEKKSVENKAHKSPAAGQETGLSSLERRRARLEEKVAKLEQQALSDKPWQLSGEVAAETRPHNSLLEEAVEFESVTRPAPMRTEQTTLRLEDIIKQRIKDKAWDDVERKQKPVESPHEYRKRIILDQEKSKLSLAEVYEQEYIKQKEKTFENAALGEEKPVEESAEHKEIRSLITGLFCKLDALCNFHYTPKMVAPELKVVTNLPAISVEEVAPAATSDATMLAPEEVKSKPHGVGEIISAAEKTATDRKRERRRKKKAQKKRAKRVMEKQKLSGTLVKGRNVSKLEDTGADRSIKSSTAFFTQLQDEVRSQVQKLGAVKRAARATSNSVDAKKLKL